MQGEAPALFRNGSSEDRRESSANNDPINATFNRNTGQDGRVINIDNTADKNALLGFANSILQHFGNK